MNSHAYPRPTAPVVHPPAPRRRWVGLTWALLLLTGLLTGCAAIKQYSVDSWQGPLPARDMKYVTAEP